MIRRDYILRMIEEFVRALARIDSLKKARRWEEATDGIDREFNRLTGQSVREAANLSETELLALSISGEPTQAVREKTLMLTALLKEVGDVATEQGRSAEARDAYLKALHLLLDTLAQAEVEDCPEFVPKVGFFVAALQLDALPPSTHARLMQHYERTGEFAKAEDSLFAMVEAESQNLAITEFGISFYHRLLAQSDAALTAGHLPREEVEQGLKEIEARRAATT